MKNEMKKWLFISLFILGSCSVSRRELYEGGISYDGENMTFSHTPPISFYDGDDFVRCIENDSIFYANIIIYGPSDYSDSYEEKRTGIEFKFIMHSLPERGKRYKLASLPYAPTSGDFDVENWNTSMPDIIGVAMTDRCPIRGLDLPDIDRNKVSKAGFLSREITDGWVMFEYIESSFSKADNYPDGSLRGRHAFKITYGFDAKMQMLSDSEVTRDIHVEGWFNMKKPLLDKKLWSFASYSTINWYLDDFYYKDGKAL